MATIGQILPNPETGWKRIFLTMDGTNYNPYFRFIPSVWTWGGTNNIYWNAGARMRFKLKGTAFRYIGVSNGAYSDNVEVKINGVIVDTFTHATPSLGVNTLLYEKTNLPDAEHFIEITNKKDTLYVNAHGIDIPDGSSLIEFAIVGEELKLPGIGWKRYDDNETVIDYSDTNLTAFSGTGAYYNNTVRFNWTDGSTKGSIKFNFTGTKIRLILSSAANAYNADHKVIIDGVEIGNIYRVPANKYCIMSFEKTGLENRMHFVEIVLASTSMGFDAIDIDSTGTLERYNTNIYRNRYLFQLSDGTAITIKDNYNNLIPKMTSNTSNGIASASSEYDGSHQAWKAFNKTNDDSFSWYAVNNAIPAWLAYEFVTPVKVDKYAITSRNYTIEDRPKTWKFEGTNDGGTTWVTLDSQTGITGWGRNERREFIISGNELRFKKYRLYIIASSNSVNIGIGELEMYVRDISSILLETPSEQDYISYGMKKDYVADLLMLLKTKSYITNNYSVIGNGKVFKKAIDTLNAPIKKVMIN